jgi:hypothetical protein
MTFWFSFAYQNKWISYYLLFRNSQNCRQHSQICREHWLDCCVWSCSSCWSIFQKEQANRSSKWAVFVHRYWRCLLLLLPVNTEKNRIRIFYVSTHLRINCNTKTLCLFLFLMQIRYLWTKELNQQSWCFLIIFLK